MNVETKKAIINGKEYEAKELSYKGKSEWVKKLNALTKNEDIEAMDILEHSFELTKKTFPQINNWDDIPESQTREASKIANEVNDINGFLYFFQSFQQERNKAEEESTPKETPEMTDSQNTPCEQG